MTIDFLSEHLNRRQVFQVLGAAAVVQLVNGPGRLDAAETDYVPIPGVFPIKPGNYLAGELVTVDPINRRGRLRLNGDFDDDRYHKAAPHDFAMLPYGMIRYHGAPAELRDIPIGTYLHGSFFLPARGEEKTIPPNKTPKYGSNYNHAILLEDDFSFYQRRGQAWKILSIDRKAGRLKVAAVGDPAPDGLAGEQTFWIDDAVKVWKGRCALEWDEMGPNQIVQLNLTWSPEWQNRQFSVAEVWINEEGRTFATERQRRIHFRYQRYHWLAGWVDKVEHQEAGHGIVTITLFGGMDKTLYEDFRALKANQWGVAVAVAEFTLRTYWQNHDCKSGNILEVTVAKDPPLGSSGFQLRWQTNGLLEGYRPGKIVRVRCPDWPNVKLAPEERIH